MSRTVVGYVRVSTETQADEGVSLEAQRAKLEAYAELYDLDLVAIHEDAGVSAKSLARPGLQSALSVLQSGRAGGLLIAKLDRLTRNVMDLGTLVSDYFTQRFDLLSVGDAIDTRSAAGRFNLNMLCSVSQWESETTGERTKEALAHLKAKGVKLGAMGLGSERTQEIDTDGHRVVRDVASEIVTVQRIGELRKRGLTLQAICDVLTDEGHQTKRGGKWSPTVVRDVLLRLGRTS